MLDRIALPDGVTVDFGREEVRGHDGARVELRARSFRVLRCLAAKAGKLVTKDELLTECWPGVVVTEDSLTQCMSDIRRALGQAGRDLIRTVPRRGYVLALPETLIAPPPPETPPAPPPNYWPSIAVLPFEEFAAGEPGGLGPLGAGFAEDITTELARNRGLPITARHDAFVAKAQGKTPTEIAKLLQVRYVLEGSVRRVGERVVINAQLIDGCDSRHVWAERYSLSAAELSTAQDELVARIASILLAEIRVAEYAASLRKPTASLDVQELTWKAIAHSRQMSGDGLIAAHAELERAVALDPGYALAHSMRGYVIVNDAAHALSGRVGPEALPGAVATIRHGIELDPLLAVSFQGLSYAHFVTGRFDEARIAAERCVALGPGDALNLAFLGLARVGVGEYAAALADIEQAIALNPVFPAYLHGIAAVALYADDRFEEASQACTAATEQCPGYTPGYVWGAAADVALGRRHEAAARVRTLLRHCPWFTAKVPLVAVVYARDPPLRARYVKHLREAGMPDG